MMDQTGARAFGWGVAVLGLGHFVTVGHCVSLSGK